MEIFNTVEMEQVGRYRFKDIAFEATFFFNSNVAVAHKPKMRHIACFGVQGSP